MQNNVQIFLCGDVMTGRGIDQILPFPGDPQLYEPFVKSAVSYVELAERYSGPIPYPVAFSYIWGDALAELNRLAPDVRLINLETAVTKSQDHWRAKGIHYKMNPENIGYLAVAGIDGCALANNHMLDWSYEGLLETLATLQDAGIRSAGAGRTLAEAKAPVMISKPGSRRVWVVSAGSASSGIPFSWAATDTQAGLFLIDESSHAAVETIAQDIAAVKQEGDVAIASIHWGDNWGYDVPNEQRKLAHRLIETAGIDIVHGHSSHHIKGMEVHKGKLILYGCGDFINDYEGIGGYELFCPDLTLMYFATLDKNGQLQELRMIPLQVRQFTLHHAKKEDATWMSELLTLEGVKFNNSVKLQEDNTLTLVW